VEKEMYIN